MPEWRDKGIVLSVRKYGEKGIIANLLTLEHGRHLGWITNYNKKNIVSHVQPGNLVDIFWKSRLIEQMGNFKIELISSVVGKILDDKVKLQAIFSICTLLEKVLPERQKYSEVFNATQAFINLLLIDDKSSQNMWVEGYVKWEIGLLSSIGFSLNLNECAVTGKKNNLYFVSPKTGKAVSKEGSGKFAPKLLLLPRFLGGVMSMKYIDSSGTITKFFKLFYIISMPISFDWKLISNFIKIIWFISMNKKYGFYF